jgi:hypothetical protein
VQHITLSYNMAFVLQTAQWQLQWWDRRTCCAVLCTGAGAKPDSLGIIQQLLHLKQQGDSTCSVTEGTAVVWRGC